MIIFYAYLLNCSPDQLNSELSKGKVDKLTYGVLASNHHKSVKDIIRETIESLLSSRSFNSMEEVFAFLRIFEIDVKLSDADNKHLAAMMKRRHQIVHRYDENPNKGKRGSHVALGIRRGDVELWHEASASLIKAIEKIVKKW